MDNNFDFNKIVDKDNVSEYISKTFTPNNGYKSIAPYPIDGIPDGFSFYAIKDREIDNLIQRGHLIGFTPGYKWNRIGAAYHKPIIVHKSDIESMEYEEGKELDEQSKEMIKLYKNNLSNLNG
jgi:hypothetical protein